MSTYATPRQISGRSKKGRVYFQPLITNFCDTCALHCSKDCFLKLLTVAVAVSRRRTILHGGTISKITGTEQTQDFQREVKEADKEESKSDERETSERTENPINGHKEGLGEKEVPASLMVTVNVKNVHQ